MSLAKITQVVGQGVYVPGTDIDTDRIIPARFMKGVTFDGLGEFLFYDVRTNEDGTHQPHPLNDPRHDNASILIVGSNFGCGSSREHAPQAIYRWGFRAIIGESFAEIFFGNCIALGMPCVTAAREDVHMLAKLTEEVPEMPIIVDIERTRVFYGLDGAKNFPVHTTDSARESLLAGRWDPIADLLEGEQEVETKASQLDYVQRPAGRGGRS
ncbi:MAG: 3-isopropylmalate dehydratase small subunit [Verrucomicrobiales bacterium]